MKQNKEKKYTKKILISIIVILSIISIVSITYNFLGGFYLDRISEYHSILGESKTIEVNNIGSFSIGLNFSGTTLIGDNIKQEVNIQTKNLNQNAKLRAKAKVSGFNDNKTILFGYTNWEYSNNNEYIIFNQEVYPNEKIGLCKFVNINDDLKIDPKLNYILIITVECYI